MEWVSMQSRLNPDASKACQCRLTCKMYCSNSIYSVTGQLTSTRVMLAMHFHKLHKATHKNNHGCFSVSCLDEQQPQCLSFETVADANTGDEH